jgi:hypothetical protein
MKRPSDYRLLDVSEWYSSLRLTKYQGTKKFPVLN